MRNSTVRIALTWPGHRIQLDDDESIVGVQTQAPHPLTPGAAIAVFIEKREMQPLPPWVTRTLMTSPNTVASPVTPPPAALENIN